MKHLARFYIWYPSELRVEPGTSTFTIEMTNYRISILGSRASVLTMSLDNSIIRKQADNKNGYKYELERYPSEFGDNQFVNFNPLNNENLDVNLLIDSDADGENYQFSKTSKYTRIILFFEINPDKEDVTDLVFKGLDKFLTVYRFVTLDTQVKTSRELEPFKPQLKGIVIPSSDADHSLTFEERCIKHEHTKLDETNHIHLLNRLKSDDDIPSLDRKTSGAHIAHYLSCNEFDEWRVLLTRAYELANEQGLFSSAVLEAFIAFEQIAFITSKEMRNKLRWKEKVPKNIAGVITEFLPKTGMSKDSIGNLHQVRQLRNKIVHDGYSCSDIEFEHSLNAINKAAEELTKFNRVRAGFSPTLPSRVNRRNLPVSCSQIRT